MYRLTFSLEYRYVTCQGDNYNLYRYFVNISYTDLITYIVVIVQNILTIRMGIDIPIRPEYTGSYESERYCF